MEILIPLLGTVELHFLAHFKRYDNKCRWNVYHAQADSLEICRDFELSDDLKFDIQNWIFSLKNWQEKHDFFKELIQPASNVFRVNFDGINLLETSEEVNLSIVHKILESDKVNISFKKIFEFINHSCDSNSDYFIWFQLLIIAGI